MGSIRTNATYDEFSPKEKQSCHNIYAISYANPGSDVPHTEVLDRVANLSLSVVVRKFINAEIEKLLETVPPSSRREPSVKTLARKKVVEVEKTHAQDENGMWVESGARGGVRGAIQVLYDRSNNVVYRIGSGYLLGKNVSDILMKDVTRWIVDNFKLNSTPTYSNAPVPFMDYEIHSLCEHDFPGMYAMARRVGVDVYAGDLADRPVLMADFDNERMAELVSSQVGSVNEGAIIVRDKPLTIGEWSGSSKDVSRHGVKLSPPYMIVNSSGKSITSIMYHVLVSLVVDMEGRAKKYYDLVKSGVDQDLAVKTIGVEVFKDKCKIALGTGTKTFGEIMYDTMDDQMGDGESWMPISDRAKKAVAAMGLVGDDVLKFLTTFLNVRDVFDMKGDGKHIYYYAVKAPKSGLVVNKLLAVEIFTFVSEPFPGIHILRSFFGLPEKAFNVFGYDGLVDVKEFDPSTNNITGFIPFEFDEKLNDNKKTNVDKEIHDKEILIIRKLHGKEVRDLSAYPGKVISIKTIPPVYVECKKMFEDRGVDFKDISIILTLMPNDKGTLGGYISPRQLTDKSRAELLKNFGGIEPPLILINMASHGMNMDKVSDVIIHEVSHYIDDLLVISGKADPDSMKPPVQVDRSTLAGLLENTKNYLSSPTEATAHAMESYTHLSKMDAEYVRKNRFFLMKKLMEQFIPPSKKYFLSKDREKGVSNLTFNSLIPANLVGMHAKVMENRDAEENSGYQVIIESVRSNSATLAGLPVEKEYLVSDGAYMIAPYDMGDEMRAAQQEGYYKIINRVFDMVLKNSRA
jgi:hypothetical protein